MYKNIFKKRLLPALLCVFMGFSFINSYAWGFFGVKKSEPRGCFGTVFNTLRKYPKTSVFLGGLGAWFATSWFKDLFDSNFGVKLPIVGGSEYNIALYYLDLLHPFDSRKHGKVESHLKKEFGLSKCNFVKPHMVTDQELRSVHTRRYLNSLTSSAIIQGIVGVPGVRLVPNWLLQRYLLNPMKLATGGTIEAAKLALKHGWAINLGGGYHHAKSDSGGGFCVYADIPIAVNQLWKENPDLRVMVVDLDAHQGNGHEMVFKDDARVSIFDMYNKDVYPCDEKAKKYIEFPVEVPIYVDGDAYIKILRKEIEDALNILEKDDRKPDLIIFNAGTDPLEGDRVGAMCVSARKMIERDEIMFQQARARKISILYLFSGGYTSESANVIGRSLTNILENYVGLQKNQLIKHVPKLFT